MADYCCVCDKRIGLTETDLPLSSDMPGYEVCTRCMNHISYAYPGANVSDSKKEESKAYLSNAILNPAIKPEVKEYIQSLLDGTLQVSTKLTQSTPYIQPRDKDGFGVAGSAFIVISIILGIISGLYLSLLVGILIALMGVCTGAILIGIGAIITEIRSMKNRIK